MGKHTIAVSVVNDTSSVITDISYLHRYDEDVYNNGHLDVLNKGDEATIGQATFWTGFLRTGYDYWWIQFTRDGQKYTCKANFYCYLTSEDADHLSKGVKLKLSNSEMEVIPPKSSNCTVRLYKSDELAKLVTQAHEVSGISNEPPAEDLSKKYCHNEQH